MLGVPDEQRGEIVAALVIPEAGAALDGEELREQVRTELSNYKVPRYILIAEDEVMPWLATGKPDRLAIKALLAARKPSYFLLATLRAKVGRGYQRLPCATSL